MTEKEKAKAYDEAIEKLRGLHDDYDSVSTLIDIKEELENIFPELCESEDEKIKKSLINYINAHGNGGDFTKEEYIAWLEKQGESYTKRDVDDAYLEGICYAKHELEKQDRQKPFDYENATIVQKDFAPKVEPKFKAGDIIKPKDGGHEPWQIMQVDILDKKYRFKDGYVIHFSQEDNYELVKQKHKVTVKIYDSVPYEDDLSGVTHQQDGDSYIVEYEGTRAQGGTTPFNHLFVYIFTQEFTPPYPALAPWHWKDVGKFTGTDGKNAADGVDKVESKFKTGDWVVSPNGVYWHVDAIRDGRYQVSSNSGESTDWPLDTNIYHRFTIEDAKDGDVLSNGKMIVIFKHFEEPSYRKHIVAYIGLDTGGNIQITDGTWTLDIDKTKPATKEQRDLLFQKMKEAGYEWDAEKKELKKIVQLTEFEDAIKDLMNDYRDAIGDNDATIEEIKEHAAYLLSLIHQKPTWSEEDEKILNSLISSLARIGASTRTDSTSINYTFSKEIDWLKSLKQRIKL